MKAPRFFLERVESLAGDYDQLRYGTAEESICIGCAGGFTGLFLELNAVLEQNSKSAMAGERMRCRRVAIDLSRMAAEGARHHRGSKPGEMAAALEALGADIEDMIGGERPSDEITTEQLKFAFRSMVSSTCPACAGWKVKGQSFCPNCMAKVPETLRRQLYFRIKRRYVVAFQKAKAALQSRVPSARDLDQVADEQATAAATAGASGGAL